MLILNMKFFLFFLAAAGLFFGGSAQAAVVFLEPESYSENGQEFYQIKFFLNTEGESVNAMEGEIVYSEQDLDFQKILDGGSVVNFWIENPQKLSDGKIFFSGGMPGGYNGEKGFIFSAVFSSASDFSSNQTDIFFQKLKIYLNDGRGTEKKLADFKISFNPKESKPVAAQSDTKPPEVFAPYVTRDPNLADGQWVVILNAQDKGEGIDRYEVFESSEKYKPEELADNNSLPWQIVKNSGVYTLLDQSLESYIYAKAVDRAGNERTAIVIPAISEKPKYFNYKAISVIIILSIVVLVAFLELFFFRRRKYEQNK